MRVNRGVVRLAPGEAPPSRGRGDKGSLNSLTPRQRQILHLIATGHSANYIASCLVLSPLTVWCHIRRIYTRLDLHNREQAKAWAVNNGLVTL